MFAVYRPSLIGQPWLDIDDWRLLDDFDYGCSAFTMAMRARRTEAEVLERLEQLGRSLDAQPKRRIRSTTWSRRSAN